MEGGKKRKEEGKERTKEGKERQRRKKIENFDPGSFPDTVL